MSTSVVVENSFIIASLQNPLKPVKRNAVIQCTLKQVAKLQIHTTLGQQILLTTCALLLHLDVRLCNTFLSDVPLK